ncbi:MAG: cell envelope integrity protein TolA [Rikenellaceae bacterium]
MSDIEQEDIERGEKPEIHLPFEHKEVDPLVWLYDHRIGVFATLGSYFFIFLMFITVKISTTTSTIFEGLMIDLAMIEELEQIKEELEEEIIEKLEELEPSEMEEDFWDEDILNEISNEGVEEDLESIEQTQQLLDQLAEAERKMEANRAAYERGMAEILSLREQGLTTAESTEEEHDGQDSNLSGSVTVSYILINPVRHSRQLIVPAYLCIGGGEVVIRITVNRRGEVVSAKVKSGGDECMQQSALKSAMASLFTPSTQAAERHTGTITYRFVPQQHRSSRVEVSTDMN